MRLARKSSVALGTATGLLLGLACALLALMLGGAGHGWCSPALFGLLSLLLSPLAFAQLGRGREGQARTSRRLLIAAGVLDLLLLLSTLQEGTRYFLRGWHEALVWLALWSTWQLAALASWLPARRPKNPIERGHETP